MRSIPGLQRDPVTGPCHPARPATARSRSTVPRRSRGCVAAGLLAAETLDFITPYVRPGVTTGELDRLCHEFVLDHGAIPAPLNYRGFPKSICTSINHVVCHGIPGDRRLMEGDILNIDVTPILDGWHGDTQPHVLCRRANSGQGAPPRRRDLRGDDARHRRRCGRARISAPSAMRSSAMPRAIAFRSCAIFAVMASAAFFTTRPRSCITAIPMTGRSCAKA